MQQGRFVVSRTRMAKSRSFYFSRGLKVQSLVLKHLAGLKRSDELLFIPNKHLLPNLELKVKVFELRVFSDVSFAHLEII